MSEQRQPIQVEEITIVTFADPRICDDRTVDTIRKKLFSPVDGSKYRLLLDFCGQTYFSSSFFRVLLAFLKRLENLKAEGISSVQLVLCSVDPEIYYVFERIGLGRRFIFAADRETVFVFFLR